MHELVQLNPGTANVLQTLRCFCQLCGHCCLLMCACRSAVKLTCWGIANAQKQLVHFQILPYVCPRDVCFAIFTSLQTTALCKLQLFANFSSLQTSALCKLQLFANFSSLQTSALCKTTALCKTSALCKLQLFANFSSLQTTALCKLQLLFYRQL